MTTQTTTAKDGAAAQPTTRSAPAKEAAAPRFDPKSHIAQIKRKDSKSGNTTVVHYLPVKWQLRWLRDEHPEAHIITELLYHDPTEHTCVFRADISIPGAGSAFGTSCKQASDRYPNYIELAETGAIGRALRHLGYGTELAAELDETAEEDPTGEATPITISATELSIMATKLNQALLSADTAAALQAAGLAIATAKERGQLSEPERALLARTYAHRSKLLAPRQAS